MKKDYSLESYVYNQFLQVVVHEQMLFMSLEASLLIFNKWHPNEPIFLHHSTQKKVFQQHQSYNL
jgi:hypothetical protein